MDNEESSLEEKCENLMCVVVATRKRFGGLCVGYEEKSAAVEKALLDLKIRRIRATVYAQNQPQVTVEDDLNIDDLEQYKKQLVVKQKRVEDLINNVNNLKQVISHLSNDEKSSTLIEYLRD